MNPADPDATPQVARPGERRTLRLGALVIEFVDAPGAAPGASALEMNLEPGWDEWPTLAFERTFLTYLVLEGCARFELAGRGLRAEREASLNVPPGVPHRFFNPFPAPAKLLVLARPGGFERYLEGLANLRARSRSWPLEDRAALVELQREHHVCEL